jgi:tRNA pseudouridine38-40 synthase
LRYFIEFAYKGTEFHGWQIQPNANSIQEELQKALKILFKTEIQVVGAGRTDAGVHAEQLFAHFNIETEFESTTYVYRLNALLPSTIIVYSIIKVKPDAHARFDALSRSYEYRIFLGNNPFNNELTWQLINKKLNIVKMNTAAEILLNYTNFKCFSRSKTDVKTYNCDVKRAIWKLNGKELTFYIKADRFLRNMVRAIVGTLIEVGEEKLSIEDFKNIIESKNRTNAGASAPARGLFLTEVNYPKSIYLNE